MGMTTWECPSRGRRPDKILTAAKWSQLRPDHVNPRHGELRTPSRAWSKGGGLVSGMQRGVHRSLPESGRSGRGSVGAAQRGTTVSWKNRRANEFEEVRSK